MPSRNNTRAANNARKEILEMLREDHKRVRKAYREFKKLDREEDQDRCQALVQEVVQQLQVHATLEEELLYPAAREAIAEPDLIDEAEVEHESARTLMEQLGSMDAEDEKFAARFTVLCEYVMHHVKEEEGELFPQLERARLDWESLAQEMRERRAELAPEEQGAEDAGAPAGRGRVAAGEGEGAEESAEDEAGRGARMPSAGGPGRGRDSVPKAGETSGSRRI